MGERTEKLRQAAAEATGARSPGYRPDPDAPPLTRGTEYDAVRTRGQVVCDRLVRVVLVAGLLVGGGLIGLALVGGGFNLFAVAGVTILISSLAGAIVLVGVSWCLRP